MDGTFLALKAEHTRAEEEAARRAEEAERATARRQAAEKREKARKKEIRDRVYGAFWQRTGLDRRQGNIFRAMAESHFGQKLAFGAPDARYSNGRPVYEYQGERPMWDAPVAVACPDPGKLRSWAEDLDILVPSFDDLEVLASRAWAPFHVHVVDLIRYKVDQARVEPLPVRA